MLSNSQVIILLKLFEIIIERPMTCTTRPDERDKFCPERLGEMRDASEYVNSIYFGGSNSFDFV